MKTSTIGLITQLSLNRYKKNRYSNLVISKVELLDAY